MEKKWDGNWTGRDAEVWIGSIGVLRQIIPTFDIWDFRIGEAVNKYKSVIVRNPVGAVSIGDAVNPMNSMVIPIEAVAKGSYKLVQHHDLLDDVLEELKDFIGHGSQGDIRVVSPLTEPRALEAYLKISIYGARMRIEFPVPNFEIKGETDTFTLKIICENSVDRSMALTVNLFLLPRSYYGQTKFSFGLHDQSYGHNDVPFLVFHHSHTQELEDEAVTRFLRRALNRLADGTWQRASVSWDDLREGIYETFSEGQSRIIFQQFEDNLRGENRVNLHRFRETLMQLEIEGKKVEWSSGDRSKFLAELIDLIYKLTEDEEKNL